MLRQSKEKKYIAPGTFALISDAWDRTGGARLVCVAISDATDLRIFIHLETFRVHVVSLFVASFSPFLFGWHGSCHKGADNTAASKWKLLSGAW